MDPPIPPQTKARPPPKCPFRVLSQKYDKPLLRDSIMEGSGGLMAELRSYVDALVRTELANLKAALERDKAGKGKGKGKGKGAGKAGKGGKGKGPKGKKDLTEGKKIESLVNELVWTGFLQQCPKVRVQDYIGAHNLMGTVMEEAEKVSAEQIDDVQKKWKQVSPEKWAGGGGGNRAHLERTINQLL